MKSVDDFHKIVVAIEKLAIEMGVEHRFVGGAAYSGLLTPNTSYDVDFTKRVVKLKNHKVLSLKRDDGTVRDVDLMVFCRNEEHLSLFRKRVDELKDALKVKDWPFISIENAIYEGVKKPNKILQFVSNLVVNSNSDFGEGKVRFCFEDISQEISWQSLEKWTVELSDGKSYSVRNPYADLLGYMVRTPIGFRTKDLAKLEFLEKLVDLVISIARKKNIDYFSDQYYAPWLSYFQKISTSRGSVGVKRDLIRGYWKIFGTKLVHGDGPIAKIISRLGNQFTGVRQ